MTQKELGERLYVSDKTVSRWECDECTPELSLIPLIADIFGITADELLRGERNHTSRDELYTDDITTRQKARSDKQFSIILDREERKFKNLSLISIGITTLGLICATIANLGFSNGLIAFCLAFAFCVASEISEICFTINSRITKDADNDAYNDKINKANKQTVTAAVLISFINICALSFCLPLVTLIDGANYGLVFEHWLLYGILFSFVALVISYIVYSLFIHKYMCEREIIVLSEEETMKKQHNNFLIKKLLLIFLGIAAVIIIAIIIINGIGRRGFTKKIVFDNCEEFKSFMESDYDRWYKEGYSYYEGTTHVTVTPVMPPSASEDNDDHTEKEYETIKNTDGEIICEYYYNRNLYTSITFTQSSDDKMPVTVITREAYYNGKDAYETILVILYMLIAIDFITVACIYVNKSYKNK